MISGDLLSAFPHRQFHTLPGLLDSWAALPNCYPNALRAMQRGSLYHFYDGLWYDPSKRQTHDLPCERRTRYRLSQPDTVCDIKLVSPVYGQLKWLHCDTVLVSKRSVWPKHTLSKVLYFILAKLKNYTLFILYFSKILYKYFIIG